MFLEGLFEVFKTILKTMLEATRRETDMSRRFKDQHAAQLRKAKDPDCREPTTPAVHTTARSMSQVLV